MAKKYNPFLDFDYSDMERRIFENLSGTTPEPTTVYPCDDCLDLKQIDGVWQQKPRKTKPRCDHDFSPLTKTCKICGANEKNYTRVYMSGWDEMFVDLGMHDITDLKIRFFDEKEEENGPYKTPFVYTGEVLVGNRPWSQFTRMGVLETLANGEATDEMRSREGSEETRARSQSDVDREGDR